MISSRQIALRVTLLLLMSSWAWTGSASAREEALRFRRLGVEEGVSHTTVWDVEIDAKGFVWILTETNLQRYDGYELRDYAYDPLDRHSLPGIDVVSAHIDRSNRLWLATSSGALGRYDPEFDRFENFPKPPFRADFVPAITTDVEGQVWLAAVGVGVARFSPSTGDWRWWGEQEGEGEEEIYRIRADSLGVIWAAGAKTIQRFSPGTDEPSIYPVPSTLPEPSASVIEGEDASEEAVWVGGIATDAEDALWVGNSRGELYRYDREEDRFVYVTSIGRGIWTMSFAPDGRLWVGAGDTGVVIYRPEDGRLRSLRFDPSNPDSLSSDEVMDFAFDRSGSTWVATRDGVSVEDRGRSAFRVLRDRRDGTGLVGTTVQVLEATPEGSLWIGMANGAVQRWDAERDRVETVYSVENAPVGVISFLGMDHSGGLLISGNSNTVHLPPGRGEWVRDPIDADLAEIRGLAVDSAGAQWYAALGAGLLRVISGELVAVPIDDSDTDADDGRSLPDGVAYSILIDRAGFVWAGLESGLARFDPKTGAVTSWKERPDGPGEPGRVESFRRFSKIRAVGSGSPHTVQGSISSTGKPGGSSTSRFEMACPAITSSAFWRMLEGGSGSARTVGSAVSIRTRGPSGTSTLKTVWPRMSS